VRILAGKLAQIDKAREWLDEHGFLDEAGQPRPAAVELLRWEEGARRLAHQLGFTVLGRVQAGFQLSSSELNAQISAFIHTVYQAIGDLQAAGELESGAVTRLYDRIEAVIEQSAPGVVERPALPAAAPGGAEAQGPAVEGAEGG
jgi:hypothetical protein